MVRDITAGLSIPEDVDELMREHIRFLYREGKALRMPMLCWQARCQTLHAGKQCEAGPYEAMHTPRCCEVYAFTRIVRVPVVVQGLTRCGIWSAQ